MVHDFTKGRLFLPMIKFTIPFILSNYLQLTYNAVDSIIVGRFLGPEALAAVGTANPLMSLLIMLLRGTTLGAGILIGSLFGAKEYERLRRQISTGLLAGGVFALILSFFVFLFSGQILNILQVDASIRGLAAGYLRIISAGLIFTFLYNYLSSVLQALGDGRTPLIFLGISAAVNILMDLLLIIVFRLGVPGAAAATVLSEAISCLLCILFIHKKVPLLDMGRKWFSFDLSLLKRTLRYGSVSAIQQATVQLGIVGVQGIVNTLGVETTAAFAAANRVDDFTLIPTRSIANAMTAVIAQNYGAGEQERIRKASKLGGLLDVGYGIAAGLLLYVIAGGAMGLFTKDPAVILEGRKYLQLIGFMYGLPALTNIIQGFFRGIGDLKVTLISSIVNMSARFLSACLFVLHLGMDIRAVPWSCLTGWLVMVAFEVPFVLLQIKQSRVKENLQN